MSRFSGTTAECLEHMFKVPYNSDIRVPLAAFCEVTEGSVQRWKSKVAVPESLKLLRVRHFLRLLGYDVSEMKDLSPIASALGRAVAFRSTTMEKVIHLIGFEGPDAHQRSAIMAFLLGRRGISSDRLLKAEVFVRALTEKTAHECAIVSKRLPSPCSKVEIVEAPRVVPKISRVAREPLPEHSGKAVAIAATANSIQTLLPLTEYLLSPECSVQDRDALHAQLEPGAVLQLVSRLRQLCSETARTGINPLKTA